MTDHPDSRLDRDALIALAADGPTRELMLHAADLRDAGHGDLVSYSRKVFIPLTRLCRDVCHYCTFAHPPRAGEAPYLSPEEVLDIARAGAEAGCREVLFTLGDKPELRYRVAREALEALGFETTIGYLTEMSRLVFEETGLLPHANPGVMTKEEIVKLRQVTVSQGIMLESASERLCEPGGPHHGSPDKHPAARLETIELAGELAVPFTSGILIGIGETWDERIDSIIALRDAHDRHGHIQEIIIQNFRAKPATKMEDAPDPDFEDLARTIALARIAFGPEMNIQAPPNLTPGDYARLVGAGINDWGGVSPVTPDHVNPEAPWPHLEELRRETDATGKLLVERLAVYPGFAIDCDRWQDKAMVRAVRRGIDSDGLARTEVWSPGLELPIPEIMAGGNVDGRVDRIIARAFGGDGLDENDIAALFQARGNSFHTVCNAADELRQKVNGDTVAYVVNRNINYTNVCYFRCGFCAFSKGKLSENLRGAPYDLALDEIARRVDEAWARGATEVCMQGGIHPDYSGETYLELCRVVKQTAPDMHIHAFSPLEIFQGAATLGITVPAFLDRLMDAGLGSLPGTAAEILDDEIRKTLCPDKLNTGEWLSVVEAAHHAGLRTTATIMYGHLDGPVSWARHLSRLRELQEKTGGFTEFVPLPFVHMEAPIYLKGLVRRGPTFRETILMHAVARLVLHPVIPNIQVSWVKMGEDGVAACLKAGVNDLGGTLMNETISRAAGTQHGQEYPPEAMEALIRNSGRVPVQRTTLYGKPDADRRAASFNAPELASVVQTPAGKYARDTAAA
ncbi:MAG: 5-amino-6-(D-ribitylamino)uracil--L-tyrosine 4-hydroxyphenyl transferase CofH [Pseudomonadota bacterium]|nr:5-amino-6-(D-ribitylamino)uracil--L-tyrosine 4-hydroxyphenyl transferase CofH [Pseudomonadota bacterium]